MAKAEESYKQEVVSLYGPAPTRTEMVSVPMYGPAPTRTEMVSVPMYGPAPTRTEPELPTKTIPPIVLYGPAPTRTEPVVTPVPEDSTPTTKANDVINCVNDIIKDLKTFNENTAYTKGKFGDSLGEASEDHIEILNGLQIFSDECLQPAMKKVVQYYNNEETIAQLQKNSDEITKSGSSTGSVSSLIQSLLAKNITLKKQINTLAETPIKPSAKGGSSVPVPTATEVIPPTTMIPVSLYGPLPTMVEPTIPVPSRPTPSEQIPVVCPPSMFHVQEKYGPPSTIVEPSVCATPYPTRIQLFVQEKYGPPLAVDDI